MTRSAGTILPPEALEAAIAGHPAVAECAVIGVADPLKGQTPLGFLCLKKGVETTPEQIGREVVKMVRDRIGPDAPVDDEEPGEDEDGEEEDEDEDDADYETYKDHL